MSERVAEFLSGSETNGGTLTITAEANNPSLCSLSHFATETTRVSLAGVPIDILDFDQFLRLLDLAEQEKRKITLLHHNLHSLYLYKTNVGIRECYRNADFIYIDGMIVVWLARLAGLSVLPQHRITFLDCFDKILAFAEDRKWRIFYLGSDKQTLARGLTTLREQYPNLLIEGRDGYLNDDPDEIERVIEQINEFKPHLLFAGMGMPNQEEFLHRHQSKLDFVAALTSGATLDYVAGTAYRPPAWAGPLGLYGVMRLCSDPKRLWHRYLLEPAILLQQIGVALLQQRWMRASHNRNPVQELDQRN